MINISTRIRKQIVIRKQRTITVQFNKNDEINVSVILARVESHLDVRNENPLKQP